MENRCENDVSGVGIQCLLIKYNLPEDRLLSLIYSLWLCNMSLYS